MAEHTLIRASGERDEERKRTERTVSIQHRKAASDLQQIMQYKAKNFLSGTFLCEKIRRLFLSQVFFLSTVILSDLYMSPCGYDLYMSPCGYALCVCVFSSHSFWTSSSLDVPAGVTQEEGHTGFFIHLLSAVRALILLERRIQPFLFLVDREVEFCVLTTLIVLHLLGIFFSVFFVFM